MATTPVPIIKKRPEFQAVYERGRRFAGFGFVLYRLLSERDQTRFGITITRRLGIAVVRNRLRRRLKAALAQCSDRIVAGYDVVLIPRWKMARAEYRDLSRDLEKILDRARLLRGGNPRA